MSRLRVVPRVSDAHLDTFSRVADAGRAADLAIDQDRCDIGRLTGTIAPSWIAERSKATDVGVLGASVA